MLKVFSTEYLKNVFAEENKYENFRSIASNLVRGNAIYELDDNGNERQVSKRQANEAVRKVFMEVLGLSEDDLRSNVKRRRAQKLHGVELFEIIEEDIEFRINEGFKDNEWFQQFVEERNLALGDANEFYSKAKQYFIVGKVAGAHHDVTMQQLGAGESFPVRVEAHAIKIGKDIDLIVLGRIDYSEWVAKVAEAFIRDIQNEVFASVYDAADDLPAAFKNTGALSSSTKAAFDALIEKVSVVNDSDVLIMGTKTALKKITALADVDWATPDQKESISKTGRLGYYEGTTLVEVPQRLEIGSLTNTLIPNDKLLIMPMSDDKFVKFVQEGETEIYEVTEKADLKDDFQTYEVQRRYGCATVLGQYFGEWTLQ